MPYFADRVYVATATTGTGTLTLGAALAGFLSFSGAAVPNGAEIHYSLVQGTAAEVGYGVYNSGAGTLTRNLIRSTTGSLLSLDGSGATVALTVSAVHLNQLPTRGAMAALAVGQVLN